MTDAPEHELSVEDALSAATALHADGLFEPAVEVYRRVLETMPDHPDALHFLGLATCAIGQAEEGLKLVERSVELVPDNAGFHTNFGNLLLLCERFEEADREYRAALALDRNRPDTLHNYAVLLKAFGLYAEAETTLNRAIHLAPNFTEACVTLAGLYERMGRNEEALEASRQALARRPHDARSREIQGLAYSRTGRLEEAAQVFRDWLAVEPDNPRARHHLAACSGAGVPPRASDAYVQTVFDAFAGSFDSRLAVLRYQGPALLEETLSAGIGPAAGDLDVLDAGCGTGLCAAVLRPFAARLEGADLSGGMLTQAARRGLYDALHQSELTAFMEAQRDRYDLVVSLDTLVYFGVLDEVFRAAAGSLRPGGHLCVTLEALPDEATEHFRLCHHGRYAHAGTYVSAALRAAGFDPIRLSRVSTRHEAGEPVPSWLVLARAPA